MNSLSDCPILPISCTPVPPSRGEDGAWGFTDNRGFKRTGYTSESEAWQAYGEFNEEEK